MDAPQSPTTAATAAADANPQAVSPTTTPMGAASNVTRDDIGLHGEWTLWFDNPRLAPAGADWKKSLKQLGTFRTVAQFWSIFNNVKPPAQLTTNSNYSVFRAGLEPCWEHPGNYDGGKFVLTIPKKDPKFSKKCDEWWLFTVLAVIGETMDLSGDQVNGAVVSIRKSQDRIALWLKCHDRETCVRIGERWKKALNLEQTVVIRYQTHKDAYASGRSFRNEIQFQV